MDMPDQYVLYGQSTYTFRAGIKTVMDMNSRIYFKPMFFIYDT